MLEWLLFAVAYGAMGGDLNGDCRVDLLDYAELQVHGDCPLVVYQVSGEVRRGDGLTLATGRTMHVTAYDDCDNPVATAPVVGGHYTLLIPAVE